MTFGETVKSLRESKNLTQKQLGEQIGISRPTINLWERGKIKPKKPETVEKLAVALGVTVKDLIGDEAVSVKEKKAAPKETISKPKKAAQEGKAEVKKEKAAQEDKDVSAEAISLATRLAILLPELSSSEKDSVMVSLNAAYWRSR